MKQKVRWVCQNCGFNTAKAMGKCPDCNTWGSLVEEQALVESQASRTRGHFAGADASGPLLLSGDLPAELPRLSTGIPSLDEVLGGGLVPGSVILLAGDPGIGKSTLLLQLAARLAEQLSVLYVSAEESRQQILMRARRLGLSASPVLLDAQQDVASICKSITGSGAQFAMIDSIQAIFNPEIQSAPGSVSQVRESAGAIMNHAKSTDTSVVIVGHVTKDGSIAGPRVLEHMVDVVLQFEGDPARQLRILRALKNRFGPTQEVAIFTMAEVGLQEVSNPSLMLLGSRLAKKAGERSPSGTAVIAACEGRRSLLIEAQSLVAFSNLASPRRVSNGYDSARLLQILAVLERRLGFPLSKHDVYVNIVGGMECQDPAGDLGIAVAIATAYMDRSVDPLLVAIGEIGLTGEIRSVVSLERRLREAAGLGFLKAVVPAACGIESGNKGGMEVIAVDTLSEALDAIVPDLSTGKKRESAKRGDDRVSPRGNRPGSSGSAVSNSYIIEDEDFSPSRSENSATEVWNDANL